MALVCGDMRPLVYAEPSRQSYQQLVTKQMSTSRSKLLHQLIQETVCWLRSSERPWRKS